MSICSISSERPATRTVSRFDVFPIGRTFLFDSYNKINPYPINKCRSSNVRILHRGVVKSKQF